MKSIRLIPLVLATIIAGCSAGKIEPPNVLCKCKTIRLQKGEMCHFAVWANKPLNPISLATRRDEEYLITVPSDQSWRDLTVMVKADGYAPTLYKQYMKLFTALKRVPSAPWFSLIGSFDPHDDSNAFLIGSKCLIRFDRSDKLYCFANDAKMFYWNNFGYLNIVIQRVK